MGTDKIEFTGYADLASYTAIHAVLFKQRLWSGSGLAFLLIFIPLATCLLQKLIPLIIAVLLIILPILFMLFAYWLSNRMRAKTIRKSLQKANIENPRTGWISSNGVHFQSGGCNAEYVWAYFTKVVEESGAIGLFQKDQPIEIFSPSMFSSLQDWTEARRLILEKVGS